MNGTDHLPPEFLEDLANYSHPPAELLEAYARKELSATPCEKVSTHLHACQECTDLLVRISEMLTEEKDFVVQETDVSEKVPIPAALTEKTRLVATLLASKDELVEEVAKVLLPRETWHIITPILLVLRDKEKKSAQTDTIQIHSVSHKAAFTAGSSEKDADTYDRVSMAFKLVDAVLLLLTDNCTSLKDARQQLSEHVEEAMATLGYSGLSEQDKKAILSIFYKKINSDDNK